MLQNVHNTIDIAGVVQDMNGIRHYRGYRWATFYKGQICYMQKLLITTSEHYTHIPVPQYATIYNAYLTIIE